MRYLPLTLVLALFGCEGLSVDRNGGDACTECGETDDTGTPEPTTLVDADGDGFTTEVDCNDSPADANSDGIVDGFFIHPNAPEICDGIDNDCDSEIDEDLETFEAFLDQDGDGYGAGDSVQTCGLPGYATVDGDCNDSDSSVHPGAEDAGGDGIDSDCDDETQPEDDGNGEDTGGDTGTDPDPDSDGDGSLDSIDCADTDPAIFPGATELDNGIDDDCDGETDEGFEPEPAVDADADGYTDAVDCDDNDAAINPGATEVCGNGVDDDCSGGDADCESPDTDGDGSTADVDCDDADATVFPGATELEDGLDNDCDSVVDEGTDSYDDDGDGYSENAGDCDDADVDLNPGEVEADNGIDDDCDGSVDEGFDADGDGYTVSEGDCDDSDAAINPDASESTAGIDDEDNDCDGSVDEIWQAQVTAEYPSSSYYVLNASFYTSGATPNSLGWQESDTESSGTTTSVDFLTEDYGDMSGACGLIININVGNPATDWYCVEWAIDESVSIDAWFNGVWYDESDVTEWIADDATGSCAAIIQVSSSSSCTPVDDVD